jgi:hypothetical protein
MGYVGNFTFEGGTVTLAAPADAHGGSGQALHLAGTTMDTALQTSLDSGCLNLAGSSGIKFWAKGSGNVTLYASDGNSMRVTPISLTSTYQQITISWTDIMFSPPILSEAVSMIWVAGPAGTAHEMFLDDISFVVP